MGRPNFSRRYDLVSDEKRAMWRDISAQIQAQKLTTIRLSFVDQHGLLRAKTIMAEDLNAVIDSGIAMTSSLLLKDISHRTVFPIWEASQIEPRLRGAGDVIMLPDPATFKVLPWATACGWLLCDLYFPDGEQVSISTRALCQRAVAELADQGFDHIAGLEVEFHVFRLQDAKLAASQSGLPAEAPDVQFLAHGYQYLTESRSDELAPVMELIRETAQKLGLPVRTMEVEFGPSQFEFSFHPTAAMLAADNMVLFRSAVKQVCRRHGYHASFMCRPALDNLLSSGWHLHQSLIDRKSGHNALPPTEAEQLLSATGQQFVAGLLNHASAGCVFSTPTINGYKRYRTGTLAPDRIHWSRDNKAAMIRIIGGVGDPATRIENRIGEPAANPYLYIGSQIQAGLNGIRSELIPPASADNPYQDDGVRLPNSLMAAVDALAADTDLRESMGEAFCRYLMQIKKAEISRFLTEVTDWEHREYFEIL